MRRERQPGRARARPYSYFCAHFRKRIGARCLPAPSPSSGVRDVGRPLHRESARDRLLDVVARYTSRYTFPAMAAALFSNAAGATLFTIPGDQPFLTVEIPDSWRAEVNQHRIEAVTSDGAARLAVEFIPGTE